MKSVAYLCFLVTLSAAAWSADEPILLGMVEDVPGVYAGEGHSSKVRALFYHQGKYWKAFPYDCGDSECLSSVTKSYPKEVAWYIGLDGRQVGKATARTPPKFDFYSHIGLQEISDGEAPVIGRASVEFSGFGGEPVRRPLVASSRPEFRDPQGWKREKVTPEVIRKALQVMRKNAPPLCKYPNEERLTPFPYGEGDLEVRAHKSNDGSQLLTVVVRDAYYCKGGDGPSGFDSQMFAISPSGESHYLGPGLMLVDAGDYDGDGASELVMSLAGYNKGGYVLFSSSFTEEARFEFTYH